MSRCRLLPMYNITDKTALRRHFKKIRESLSEKPEKSRRIQEKLLINPAILQANSVFLYLSIGSEVETLALMKELLSLGKRVAVPLCDKETKTMVAVEVAETRSLRPGTYGIWEPDPDSPVLPKEEIDVVLVPGLAFDKEGYRLGYGGGYYDKFLADFSGRTIGLAFSESVTDTLPREEFDLPVDEVITA